MAALTINELQEAEADAPGNLLIQQANGTRRISRGDLVPGFIGTDFELTTFTDATTGSEAFLANFTEEVPAEDYDRFIIYSPEGNIENSCWQATVEGVTTWPTYRQFVDDPALRVPAPGHGATFRTLIPFGASSHAVITMAWLSTGTRINSIQVHTIPQQPVTHLVGVRYI